MNTMLIGANDERQIQHRQMQVEAMAKLDALPTKNPLSSPQRGGLTMTGLPGPEMSTSLSVATPASSPYSSKVVE